MRPAMTTPANETARPEFIRLPTKGRDPFFGLTRSYFYQLIERGQIESFTLRQRGQKNGVRLVKYDSVRDYILRHREGGRP